MSSATLSKSFEFHAAHILRNHDGQCSRLHGHTYKFEVSVTGPILQPYGGPDEGMVLDFSVLKTIYKTRIEPLVEHQFLNDTLAGQMPSAGGAHSEALTTAENLAVWMVKQFREALISREGSTVFPNFGIADTVVVRLWETPTSSVMVSAESL